MTINIFNKELLINYKAFPGPIENYHNAPSFVMQMLLENGFDETKNFLDIGCGPLRMGRLFITFLLPNKYYGIEPEVAMVEQGLQEEIVKPFSNKLLWYKKPLFTYNSVFNIDEFDVKFDFVLASQVFIHCGKAQLIQCLSNIRTKLYSKSKLFFNINVQNHTGELAKGVDKKWSYKYASHCGACYKEDDFIKIAENFGYKALRLNKFYFLLTPNFSL